MAVGTCAIRSQRHHPPGCSRPPHSALASCLLTQRLTDLLPLPCAAVAPRAWRALLHTNGVTVYAEEESSDGAGGGLMVSAVVRAPPSDTFKASARSSRAPAAVRSGERAAANLVCALGSLHQLRLWWKASRRAFPAPRVVCTALLNIGARFPVEALLTIFPVEALLAIEDCSMFTHC